MVFGLLSRSVKYRNVALHCLMKPELMDKDVDLCMKYETELISWGGFSIVLSVRICVSSCRERLHHAEAKYTWSLMLRSSICEPYSLVTDQFAACSLNK